MTEPEQIAEKVRVFLVWDADTSGTFLDSIHATRETADQKANELGSGWVDHDWWIEPALNDGTECG